MNYLLDTNVISALRKPQAFPAVRAWFAGVAEDSLYLSVITLGEIRKGIDKKRALDPAQAQALEAWLHELAARYARRILPFDRLAAECWGGMLAISDHHAIDAQLAATASVHKMTLVTRNTRHVEMFDVSLLNPFDLR